jgi:hypothetical protein
MASPRQYNARTHPDGCTEVPSIDRLSPHRCPGERVTLMGKTTLLPPQPAPVNRTAEGECVQADAAARQLTAVRGS